MLSPSTVGTIKKTNSDNVVYDGSANSKIEMNKRKLVSDRGNVDDCSPDRDQFSHHHEDGIKMGDSGEHG